MLFEYFEHMANANREREDAEPICASCNNTGHVVDGDDLQPCDACTYVEDEYSADDSYPLSLVEERDERRRVRCYVCHALFRLPPHCEPNDVRVEWCNACLGISPEQARTSDLVQRLAKRSAA